MVKSCPPLLIPSPFLPESKQTFVTRVMMVKEEMLAAVAQMTRLGFWILDAKILIDLLTFYTLCSNSKARGKS